MGANKRKTLLGICLIAFGTGLAAVCITFGLAQRDTGDSTEKRHASPALAPVEERAEGARKESDAEMREQKTESLQRTADRSEQGMIAVDKQGRKRRETHLEREVKRLGFASVCDFLAQIGSFEGFDHDPTSHCKERNIANLRSQILSGATSIDDLDRELRFYRLTREDVLTPEFLAELAADRERGRQLQLENIERLRTCPPWPIGRRPDPGVSIEEGQRQIEAWAKQNRELEASHKPVKLWAQQPLSEDVKAAVLAALQDRYARLSLEDAAYDRALCMLISAAGAYCGSEGRELLKNLYSACSHEWLRVRFFNAYVDTLGRTLQAADFLFQAMTTDPFQSVRSQARQTFEEMLADASETWRWDEWSDMPTIAHKYAGYKKELLYGVIHTGDTDELVRVIGKLSGAVESDAAFLVEFAKNSPHVEVRLAALGQLDKSDSKAMSLTDRAAIYRELYARKDSSPCVRERCISILGTLRYIKNAANLALIKEAMSDPDEGVRRTASWIIEDYEENKTRFPDRYEDDE